MVSDGESKLISKETNKSKNHLVSIVEYFGSRPLAFHSRFHEVSIVSSVIGLNFEIFMPSIKMK